MVCNISFISHKSLQLKARKPFKILVICVGILCLIAYMPSLGGFLFFITYALSGPFELIMGWKKPTKEDDIFKNFNEEDDDDE